MPLASLPIIFAVAGAIRRRSIVDARAMCSMSELAPGSNWSVITPRRVIASNVIGPTKRVAVAVMIATTSWPRFCSPRATSTALYAPIPPVTPRAISMVKRDCLPRLFDLLAVFGDLGHGPGDDFLLGN